MITTSHIEILAHPKAHTCWITLYSAKKFKRVTNCKVVTTGARSDHSPIQAKFKLRAIKLNIPKEDTIVIDWKKIRTDKYYGKILMINCTYN